MERSVQIVPATLGLVAEISPFIRDCDRDEIWAQVRQEPEVALTHIVRAHPDDTRVCLLDGAPVAIFGIVEDLTWALEERSGVLWMIGTDAIYDNVDLFREYTQAWLEYYRSRYHRITNWVDERNTAAVEWIKSVGFEVHDAVPHGAAGELFHFFEWRAS